MIQINQKEMFIILIISYLPNIQKMVHILNHFMIFIIINVIINQVYFYHIIILIFF